jgi:hypothetical protein
MHFGLNAKTKPNETPNAKSKHKAFVAAKTTWISLPSYGIFRELPLLWRLVRLNKA